MTKIKICGLTNKNDIAMVNQYLPDYIGFVFAESRRQISVEEARNCSEILDRRIKAVGVFVNASIDQIVYLCRENIIQMIQLHGDEGLDYILQLKEAVSNPIIKAIRVRTKEQVIQQSLTPCDYLLLDSYICGQYGGSGNRFNLDIIPTLTTPFFLAGGMNKDNMSETIQQINPYCIDVSSGVETEGKKDEKKIEEVIRLVRKFA